MLNMTLLHMTGKVWKVLNDSKTIKNESFGICREGWKSFIREKKSQSWNSAPLDWKIWLKKFSRKVKRAVSQTKHEDVAFSPWKAMVSDKLWAEWDTKTNFRASLKLAQIPRGTVWKIWIWLYLECIMDDQTFILDLWAGNKHIIRQREKSPMQHFKKTKNEKSLSSPFVGSS